MLIELKPLESHSIAELLSDLIPESEHLDQLGLSLHQFTGGNPLFIVETMRALREQGNLETLTPERFENRRRALGLVQSSKVGAVITRRLERLTPHAKDLAQVAAIMQQAFTLERAAQILETSRLELAKASEELQTAHLWRGLQFSHDLVFETVLENIPESTKVVLHGSALEVLEKAGIAATILASHAIGAERLEATVHYSLKAGFEAFEMRALPEAIGHLEVVRQIILEPPTGFDLRTIITDNERFQIYCTLFHCYESTGTDQRLLERQVIAEMNTFGSEAQDANIKAEIQFVLTKDFYYQTWGGGDYPDVAPNQTRASQKE